MKGKILGGCVFILLYGALAAGISGGEESPSARVRTMLDQVVGVQTDPRLQGEEFRGRRRAAIKKIIGQNFHFDGMGKKALGPHWEQLKGPQRAEFRTLFQDLFQESYTRLVLDFVRQEKILFLGEEVRPGLTLVKTRMIRTQEEIPVDYSLVWVGGEWLVEDVAIEGVGIVQNYRKSFAQVIRRESISGLLKRMRLQRQALEKSS